MSKINGGGLSARWQSSREFHDNVEAAEVDGCARSPTGDHFFNYVLCERALSLMYITVFRLFSFNGLFHSIHEESRHRASNGLN